ncbi:LPD38 domain-containing protein [Comamonas sp. B-9]|uniref:LPD38 domain-containing protein n=1 Tax=Comamonas sp. B-9 TaxID=1055192 RepID=UPI000428AD75|nr:LPD38 domain-containing protein [Comamonas sp. B-9]
MQSFLSRAPNKLSTSSNQPATNSKLAQLQAKARSLLDPSKVDTWLYHWQDKFIDLKRIQEQIKALNGTVSETNDAYRGEELYHKRVAKRAANFLRDEVRPLMKAMNDAGVGIEEFERYLHARHAAEANKAMAKRNPSQQELVAKRATADQTVPYRWAARGINAATGGSEWEQGAISPTPEAIQYLVEQAFGGVLREANKLGATATAAATGEELAPHQWFLAGRVYGNTTGMNGQSDTYYDNTKRINVALAEAKARVERGENVDAVLKEVPLAKAAGVEKLADKRVAELTKLRRKVQASDLPDKKDQVKAINKEIESTMRLLNQAVAEVVKQPS